MGTPDFIQELRRHIGTTPLWLAGMSCVILRPGPRGQQVLLAQRADNGAWTLICGIIDPGEEPDTTAVREAREEAGVEIAVERVLSMQALPEITYSNGDRSAYLDIGLRARWIGGDAHVADDESRAVGWFDTDDLPPGLNDRFRATIALALADEAGIVMGSAAAPGARRYGTSAV